MFRKSKPLKAAAVLALALSTSGCLTIGSSVKFNDDMSGSMVLLAAPKPDANLTPSQMDPQLAGPNYRRTYETWLGRPSVKESVRFDRWDQVRLNEGQLAVRPSPSNPNSGSIIQTLSMNLDNLTMDQMNVFRLFLINEKFLIWIDPPGEITTAHPVNLGSQSVYPEIEDGSARYNLPMDVAMAQAWSKRPLVVKVDYRIREAPRSTVQNQAPSGSGAPNSQPQRRESPGLQLR